MIKWLILRYFVGIIEFIVNCEIDVLMVLFMVVVFGFKVFLFMLDLFDNRKVFKLFSKGLLFVLL